MAVGSTRRGRKLDGPMTKQILLTFVIVLTQFPHYGFSQHDSGGSGNLMGLISTRDIAELTQIATEIAAQTMQSNGELLAKPGGDEVRPLPMNARPSELFSQGLTNLMQPARQQLAKALQQPGSPLLPSTALPNGQGPPNEAEGIEQQKPVFMRQLDRNGGGSGAGVVDGMSALRNLFAPQQSSSSSGSRPIALGSTTSTAGGDGSTNIAATGDALLRLANTFLGSGTTSNSGYYSYGNSDDEDKQTLMSGRAQPVKMNSAVMRLFNSGMQTAKGDRDRPAVEQQRNSGFFGGNSGSNGGGGGGSTRTGQLFPSLKQLFSGANQNFGFRQGEGCLPFIGEFMKMAYGNCVRQADEKTWDTWGKQITNALMGGKIDLLSASKETCKKGAEREQCGQLRKAVSECDILGSIQLASNLQRSVTRCDEISGVLDQNPTTVMNQMTGLINGEMAQGFLNNFLG